MPSILRKLASRMVELKESTLRARSSINSAKASQSTAFEKTSNCESALDQEHEQLNSLEARFSKIEEEREQLAVEIRYLHLQAKDAEFLKQQDSLIAELKKANEGISRKLAELEERSPETRLLMPTDPLEVGTRRCQRS